MLLALETDDEDARAMLGNTEVASFNVKIPWGTLRLMVSKTAGLLVTEKVIQDGLHRLPDARNSFARATVCDQSAYVLQEEGCRLFDPNNFLYIEKERATSIRKSLFVPRLAEGLARKASAKDVKSWDTSLRVHLCDITLEILIIVREQSPVGTVIEVMTVGLTGGRVPLARKHALRPLGIVESYVKTTDSGEKIDELVDGLFGHALHMHILSRFKSHKWTPVHPGELKSNP